MPLALIYHWFLCKRSRFLLSYNLIRCIPRPHAAPASPAIAAAMTSSGPCLAPGCCPCAVRSPASPATGPSRMFRRSCRHRLTEAQASGGHACTATGRGCSCTTSPVAPPPHRRLSSRLLRQDGGLRRSVQVHIAEAAPEWTLDQIAGLVFGGFLLVTITLALQVDVVVAKAQRRDLGICETCGGVYNPDECASGNCPKK